MPASQAASFSVSSWRCSVSMSEATKHCGDSPFACTPKSFSTTPSNLRRRHARERGSTTHHAFAHVTVEAFEHLRLGAVPRAPLALPLRGPLWEVLHGGEDVDEEAAGDDRARDARGVRVNALDDRFVLVPNSRPAVHGRKDARRRCPARTAVRRARRESRVRRKREYGSA